MWRNFGIFAFLPRLLPLEAPLSVDVLVVLAIVAVAVVLLVFQPVPIDATAIGVMVALILLGPWTGVFPEEGISYEV